MRILDFFRKEYKIDFEGVERDRTALLLIQGEVEDMRTRYDDHLFFFKTLRAIQLLIGFLNSLLIKKGASNA